jgi:alpha-mannosidase
MEVNLSDAHKFIHVIPHSHIDVEWYWTASTTRLWTEDILSRAMDLLRRDPDYRFTQDQVYLIKEFYDSLSLPEQSTFRRFVSEGRLELVGGMFVQPEVAEPNGECLVRQILYGQAWLQATFGFRSRIGWMIDTFGQIPQLPQVLARSGFSHVVFWRDISPEVDFERMPADFLWMSPDGSRIRARWLPGGYSDNPKQTRLAMDHNKLTNVLLPYGGDVVRPTQISSEVLQEVSERLANLGFHPASLRVSTAGEYFTAADAEGASFPVLDCDFNPPFYGQDLRGTYDNRIRQKLLNRAAERSLLNAELLSALAVLHTATYPKAALDELWKKLLFSQFHDTIACSSYDPVYVGAMERLRFVKETADSLGAGALGVVAGCGETCGSQLVVFNPLSFPRSAVCRFELPPENSTGVTVLDEQGHALPGVVLHDGQAVTQYEFVATDLPPVGFRVYQLGPSASDVMIQQPDKSRTSLENTFFRIHWDVNNGDLTSLWDKTAGCEILSGSGNAMVAMREKNPDLEGNIYLTREEARSGQYPVTCIDNLSDALAERVQITSSFQDCSLIRTVSLYRDIARVDFETTVLDFKGGDVMLKVSFPLALDWAHVRPVYETAFAATGRPFGHYASQTWVDCSDSTRGATLFNYGTPGYWVGDGSLELTLLRSFANYMGYRRRGLPKGIPGYDHSTQTELAREHGTHHFCYSLYPHAKLDHPGELFHIGQSLNTPPVVLVNCACAGPVQASYIACDPDFVMTMLKQAEDGQGLVLRGFETSGLSHDVMLSLAIPVREVRRCDLMEEPLERMDMHIGKIVFHCAPFEIVTVKLVTSSQDPG